MPSMQAITDGASNSVAAPRISEFIFSGEPRQQLPLILPVLSHLSRLGDSRWLTCIGTSFLAKKNCTDFQIDWRRLLQVLPSARCDAFELARRALTAGKSHTVVCVIASAASPRQLALLEQAAALGDCRCILVRGRQGFSIEK